jgi:Sulfotransferase family
VCGSSNREAVCDGHWGRQVDLLLYDLIPYDVVGRFENFASDFRSILARIGAPSSIVEMADEVMNPTATVPLAAVFDSALAAIVYEHYRADFEAFGYDRESWRYYTSWARGPA